jgi:hypothetical protein
VPMPTLSRGDPIDLLVRRGQHQVVICSRRLLTPGGPRPAIGAGPGTPEPATLQKPQGHHDRRAKPTYGSFHTRPRLRGQSANSSARMKLQHRGDSQQHDDQVVDCSRASDEVRGHVEFLVPSS